MKELIREIQRMSDKKEHECVRFTSRLRRANQKKTKSQINTSLFTSRREIKNSYFIVQKKKKEEKSTTRSLSDDDVLTMSSRDLLR
jgi:hypothetical protein